MVDSLNMRRSYEWLQQLRDNGYKFPNSYIVFDMETSGLDPRQDLALQTGYAIVEDGKITFPPTAHLLNWKMVGSDVVDQGWLQARIQATAEKIKEKGGTYKFTYEGLSDGIDPLQLLKGYAVAFQRWQCSGKYFMAHNGFKYDTRMIENHFQRFVDCEFRFDLNKLIDTGLFEKAMQQHTWVIPNRPSDMCYFYGQISDKHSRIKWSLSRDCLQKYDLVEKHNLDLSKAHSADFDCIGTHLLYQEYRRIALELE